MEPYAIRAVFGNTFAYTKNAAQYDHGAFGGWIEDRRVMQAGAAPKFSRDGQHLYWLEDAGTADGLGDLWVFDLKTGTPRALVRNVSQYDLLPNGRPVAIANAVQKGAWNRAIVVDEAAGQARLLMDNAQSLHVVGTHVVVTRSDDGTMMMLTP